MLTKAEKIEVLKQFQKKFDAHVNFFKSDFCHDAVAVLNDPEYEYIYFLRETGSWIGRLTSKESQDGNDNSHSTLIEKVITGNPHRYFWDGKAMQEVSPDWIRDKLQHHDLAIG